MNAARSPGRRLRRALHRRRSRHLFVSFPKSGRTWTKRVLERYYGLRCGVPELDFETWTPLVRLGPERAVPRLVFSHAVTRYADPAELERFIAGARDRRVVLQVRDPRAVVLTYYFRLVRRMDDREATRLTFPEFLRHPVLGVRRVVEFMTLWHAHRREFRDFLLLRYEDNVARPEAAFSRLLSFLGTPVDGELLRRAVGETPDPTRDIEIGGFADRARPADGGSGTSPADGVWRDADLPGWRDALDASDRAWLQEQVAALPPELGYREPAEGGR